MKLDPVEKNSLLTLWQMDISDEHPDHFFYSLCEYWQLGNLFFFLSILNWILSMLSAHSALILDEGGLSDWVLYGL